MNKEWLVNNLPLIYAMYWCISEPQTDFKFSLDSPKEFISDVKSFTFYLNNWWQNIKLIILNFVLSTYVPWNCKTFTFIYLGVYTNVMNSLCLYIHYCEKTPYKVAVSNPISHGGEHWLHLLFDPFFPSIQSFSFSIPTTHSHSRLEMVIGDEICRITDFKDALEITGCTIRFSKFHDLLDNMYTSY